MWGTESALSWFSLKHGTSLTSRLNTDACRKCKARLNKSKDFYSPWGPDGIKLLSRYQRSKCCSVAQSLPNRYAKHIIVHNRVALPSAASGEETADGSHHRHVRGNGAVEMSAFAAHFLRRVSLRPPSTAWSRSSGHSCWISRTD